MSCLRSAWYSLQLTWVVIKLGLVSRGDSSSSSCFSSSPLSTLLSVGRCSVTPKLTIRIAGLLSTSEGNSLPVRLSDRLNRLVWRLICRLNGWFVDGVLLMREKLGWSLAFWNSESNLTFRRSLQVLYPEALSQTIFTHMHTVKGILHRHSLLKVLYTDVLY